MSGEIIDLGSIENAFAQGGNRLCFVDPRDKNKCVKVLRPDRTPDIRRSQQSLLKRLRRLESYDENLNEFKIITEIFQRSGRGVSDLITTVYTFVETNFGKGLVTGLVRDATGEISISLKQYLWLNGCNESLSNEIASFGAAWEKLAIPSRKLLLHNILVKIGTDSLPKLIVIDGLGDPTLFSVSKLSKNLARFRAKRKVDELESTIQELLNRKEAGKDFGVHGWLNDTRSL